MPATFVHVSVNVVTAVSVTLVACPRVTAPTPRSIEHVGSGNVGSVPYDHVHVTIVGTPAGSDAGDATNDVIVGAIAGPSSGGPSMPLSFGLSEPPPPHASVAAVSKSNKRIRSPPKEDSQFDYARACPCTVKGNPRHARVSCCGMLRRMADSDEVL